MKGKSKRKGNAGALRNDSIPRAEIGRELQRRINLFQLSRDKAAKIVDDAPSQMSRLMTGHFEEFSADRMVKMLLRLGTDVELILTHGPRIRRRRRARISVRRSR